MTSPHATTILLNALQSPVNIGRILRTCEVFQVGVSIFDPTRVLQDQEKRRTVSDFSCGALERTRLAKAEDLTRKENVLKLKERGRLIATCVGQNAIELPDFSFENNDIVVIGNEYDGLSEDFIALADEKLYIPMPEVYVPKFRSYSPIDPNRDEDVQQNGLANLSASTCANIIAYSIYLQARKKA